MSQFKTKLNTNYTPTQQEQKSIREFLVKPQILLDELHGKILQQEAILQQLRGQYDELLKTVHSYRTLLSPIRQVPDDILGEIFVHCLPCDRNATLYPRDPPVSLTHICSRWRKVALRTPRLWASLHICTYSAYDEAWEDDTVDERDALVEKWVSRAGGMPLSLSLFPKPSSPSRSNSDDIQRLLALVSTTSRLWDTLEMFYAVNYDDYERPALEGNVSLAFRQARKLRLHFQIICSASRLGIYCPPSVADALFKTISLERNPHLRELSLSINLDPNISLSFIQYIPCAQLEVLDLRNQKDNLRSQFYSINPSSIATLLHQCPNLIVFKVNVTSFGATSQTRQLVVMPKLKHLYFALANLWQLRLAPSIFEYVCPKLISFHLRGWKSSPPPVLSAYFQKVGYLLTSLTLDSSVPIATLLPMLPALVQLHLEGVIHSDPDYQNDISSMEGSYPGVNAEVMEILITPSPGDRSVPHLCPNLQYLRWDHSTYFSDDSLARMITTRATSPFSVPLKQVRIYFGRPIERDILPDCKEAVDAGLDLRLEYAPNLENPIDVPFVKLGLPARQYPPTFGWN